MPGLIQTGVLFKQATVRLSPSRFLCPGQRLGLLASLSSGFAAGLRLHRHRGAAIEALKGRFYDSIAHSFDAFDIDCPVFGNGAQPTDEEVTRR